MPIVDFFHNSAGRVLIQVVGTFKDGGEIQVVFEVWGEEPVIKYQGDSLSMAYGDMAVWVRSLKNHAANANVKHIMTTDFK